MALEKTDKFLTMSDSGNAVLIKLGDENWLISPKTGIEKLLRGEIKGCPLKRIVPEADSKDNKDSK